MPRVRVTHETAYRYKEPVSLLSHRLMLRPRDSHDLRLLETKLTRLAARGVHPVGA